MNARIKKLWVKALRSGKYKQGIGQLRRDNGEPKFCCLGVLCDIHAKTRQGQTWNEDGSYDDEDSDLPLSVVEWAELDSSDPVLGTKRRASQINDAGESFEYIAKLIEKRL